MVSNSNLAIVLKHIPKLSLPELKAVQLRLSFLLGTCPSKAAPTDDWLLEGILAELRKRGLWARKVTFPKNILPTYYEAKAAIVRDHLLLGVAKPNLRPPERMSLGTLAAMALADYLMKVQVPVSPKTMLNNIEKIPLALEESYPGYWDQKLLGFYLGANLRPEMNGC